MLKGKTSEETSLAKNLFEGLTFKVATGSERIRALQARRDVYARDWPEIPTDKVVDQVDGVASQLIACTLDGDIIASLRIVTSEHRPFDMERFISIDSMISPGRSPAEIGRLIVKHNHRHVQSHSFVQLGIFKLSVDLSLQLGVTDLLLTALPTLRNLYRIAGFADTGLAFKHTTWGDVHVMRLDLAKMRTDGNRSAKGLLGILQSSGLPNFVLR